MKKSDENINKLCEYYIKTLVWNMKYYLNECPSWDWYYPYHYAPTFHDIYLYLKEFKSLTHIKFNLGKPEILSISLVSNLKILNKNIGSEVIK